MATLFVRGRVGRRGIIVPLPFMLAMSRASATLGVAPGLMLLMIGVFAMLRLCPRLVRITLIACAFVWVALMPNGRLRKGWRHIGHQFGVPGMLLLMVRVFAMSRLRLVRIGLRACTFHWVPLTSCGRLSKRRRHIGHGLGVIGELALGARDMILVLRGPVHEEVRWRT